MPESDAALHPFRPPRWAWALIIALALIDPVSHVMVRHFPPEGTVPTGGHIVDTFNYLAGMEYAHPPWWSPYNLCNSPYADGDPSLFAIPHHHLFGAIGTVGGWLHIPPFYMMGLANGLGLLFYLYAAYTFLASAVPRLAGRAFVLFCLGGGLGGLLYVLTWPFGVHDHPEFGRYFERYFIYELSEGPRFQPWLMAARIYYTLAFGFGFLALTVLWRGLSKHRVALLPLVALLLALTTLANFRVGPMLWGAAAIIIFCRADWPWKRRIGWAAGSFAGVAVGGGIALAMVSRNPDLIETVARSARLALWFSPFISATFFYWLVIHGPLLRSVNRAPQWLRYAGWGAVGYITAYATLYVLYQAYYGNVLITGEFQVAVRMTDWALVLGVPAGFALAGWLGPAKAEDAASDHQEEAAAPPWAALWLLAFFALSFSAWGQGWFLKYTPDRFIIVIGVPLAILGAAAIERGLPCCPRLFRGIQAAIITCGMLSILTTWLVSYGPLGYHTLQQHYSWTRNAFMNEADGQALDHLDEEGVVLAPSLGAPLMGDIAVLRGNATVHGVGSIDYTRHVANNIRAQVAEFFDPLTPDALRKEMAKRWCARYVYCPDTDPVDPATVAQLRASTWLEEIASYSNAVVFEVR